MRVNFYIDGLNVYHRIRDYLKVTGVDYRWLDYRRVCEKVLRPHEVLEKIYFFTAINHNISSESIDRHERFIRAMKIRGVEVVQGYFRNGKEKQTDVNIVVHMLSDAVRRQCGKCVLFSADNDFVPALLAVSELSHGAVRTMLMIAPCARGINELKKSVDERVKITPEILKGQALPEKMQVAGEMAILKPEEYPLF